METREKLEHELAVIRQWEREQKDLWFWEKLGRLPFVLLDKLTPAFLQEKLGQAINELVEYGGRYLIQQESILQLFKKHLSTQRQEQAENNITIDDIGKLELATMDEVAHHLRNNYSKVAAVQGATTGIGGLFTLAIDIPVLLGLSLKTLQEIAICYGYDPSTKHERIFIMKCLQFTAADIVGKRAILQEISDFESETKRNSAISQLQGWREVIITYRDNLGWKKLFQIVPIAGILFGAYVNRKTIDEIAETGMMLYRKRRIIEKLNG